MGQKQRFIGYIENVEAKTNNLHQPEHNIPKIKHGEGGIMLRVSSELIRKQVKLNAGKPQENTAGESLRRLRSRRMA